ncbi:MAG TPA: enoyl-CoA hydratase family protein [Vicinamibacteria bacterium]
MKPEPKSFRYQEDGPVATLRLDRPEVMNALTFEVYRELTATFMALAARPQLRAVVLTGTGRAFCTGGDVRGIIGELVHYDERRLQEFTRLTCDLIAAMRALPRPIVASLNGPTAGAGAAMALACDLRVASSTAKIAFLFVKVGLAGADMGVAHLLPRVVGLSKASELLLTGEFVDAEEARRIGLYNRVVAPDRLAEETAALVASLVSGPAEGIAATKAALNAEMTMDVFSALDYEARVQAGLMTRPDFQEGYRAFVEKRKPHFDGSPD